MPKYPATIKIKTAGTANHIRGTAWRVLSGEWSAGAEVGSAGVGFAEGAGDVGGGTVVILISRTVNVCGG